MSGDTHTIAPLSEASNRENGSKLALGMIGTSFVGTIALISPFIIMQLRSPLPYMATPRRKILAALKTISQQKALETPRLSPNSKKHLKSLRYYDLGSGDGETVLAAASAGWKATGIELNSTLWGISSIRRILSPQSIRGKSNFIWANMWKQQISDADAVMIFGVKPLMAKVAKKIETECKPGTYVMSYRFLVPLQPEIEEHESSNKNDAKESIGLQAKLVYDEEEMRIYKLKG